MFLRALQHIRGKNLEFASDVKKSLYSFFPFFPKWLCYLACYLAEKKRENKKNTKYIKILIHFFVKKVINPKTNFLFKKIRPKMFSQPKSLIESYFLFRSLKMGMNFVFGCVSVFFLFFELHTKSATTNNHRTQ